MFIKRILILVLALTLTLSFAAAEETDTLPDMDGLTALVDALTDTLHAQELTAYTAGAEDAPAEVSYGLIWRLLYRGQIPAQVSEDGSITLSASELSALYDGLLAAGSFVMPEEDCCEAITRTADGLRFDVSTAPGSCAGMQVMLVDAGASPDTQTLLCETYAAPVDWYALDDESLLTADWYGTVLIEVQRDEAAPLGWRIVSFAPAVDTDDGASVG